MRPELAVSCCVPSRAIRTRWTTPAAATCTGCTGGWTGSTPTRRSCSRSVAAGVSDSRPGRNLLGGKPTATDTAADRPPDWSLKPNEISLDKPDNLIELAKTYRATNLPAPPDKKISVVRTLSVEVGKDWAPSSDKQGVSNPPTATKEVDMPVPSNYEVTHICYEGVGYPLQWWWVTPEPVQPVAPLWIPLPFATVSIGNESKQHWNGGTTIHDAPLSMGVSTAAGVPDHRVSIQRDQLRTRDLAIGKDAAGNPATAEVELKPPARDLVKIAVTTSGLAQCTVTALAKCSLARNPNTRGGSPSIDTLYGRGRAGGGTTTRPDARRVRVYGRRRRQHPTQRADDP